MYRNSPGHDRQYEECDYDDGLGWELEPATLRAGAFVLVKVVIFHTVEAQHALMLGGGGGERLVL